MNISAFALTPLPSCKARTYSRTPPLCSTSSRPVDDSTRIIITRRAALSTLATALAASLLDGKLPAHAAVDTATFMEVSNDMFGYAFSAPTAGWTRTDTALGMRQLVAFVKDGSDGDVNISMVATPISGDYKKLTSFGTMDTVLNTLVPSDKKTGVSGEIISAELNTKMNAYVCEYTITPGVGKDKRHLLTVFSLQPGRFIITLTAQTKDDNWDTNAPLFRRVADSYRIKIMDD